MGVLDFLFEGSPPPNINSATVTQTNMPDWYQEYTRGLLSKSNQVAAQDYQPYTGARVADFTAPTTQSFDLTQQNVGAWQPAMDTAQTALGGVAGGFNQGQFQNYMNPYTSQVNDVIAQLGARNLSENILPQVNQTFTGAGQFGGSRNAEFTNRAIRDTQQSILNQQAQNMNQGFQNAMQNYLTGQGQDIAAGQQLTNLGQQQQAAGLRDAAALNAVGQQQQQQTQAGLDVGYNNFLEQRNWPIQMAQFMNQQVRGFNPPTSQAQSYAGPGTNYQPSPLAQVASAVTGGLGLQKLMNG
jgi:hypothetical protein